MQVMFTGIDGFDGAEPADIQLQSGFSLVTTNNYLSSAQLGDQMTGSERRVGAKFSRYLVYKGPGALGVQYSHSEIRTFEEVEKIFLDALVAIQMLKPVKTQGLLFYGQETDEGVENLKRFSLVSIVRRPPMEPGPYAMRKRFDQSLLGQLPKEIEKVSFAMDSSNIELKNGFSLLQLGLEHPHPLIAALLWVIGIEAVVNETSDGFGIDNFILRLGRCLGLDSPVFPDWHVPQDTRTVRDVAYDLYFLRNQLCHGIDLSAGQNKKRPVDLLALHNAPNRCEQVPYALLLSEIACYVLCQVLKRKVFGLNAKD